MTRFADTSPHSEVRAAATLFDVLSGRVEGGHQEYYLACLERCLEGFDVRTFAPYRGTGGRRRSRALEYWTTFRHAVRCFRAPEPRTAVFHTPEFRDMLCLAAAGLFRPRSDHAPAILVMRRNPAGLIGRDGPKARLLEWTVVALARSGAVRLVSDSEPAAAFWADRAGVPVPLLPLPQRASAGRVPRTGPLRIGMIGAFRPEKGAADYPAVFRAARRTIPDARLFCQVPAGEVEPGSPAAAVIEAAAAHGRVDLHHGHLSDADYDAALTGLDVVCLPYDTVAYGTGTSGVMFDALGAGCTVLVTPIEWARRTFDGHPGVVWLDGTTEDRIAEGLTRAAALATARRDGRGVPQAPPLEDRFRDAWREIVEGTCTSASTRPGAITSKKGRSL